MPAPTPRILTPVVAVLALLMALCVHVPSAAAASNNLVNNPGFESGSLSGWTCASDASVVKTPVHSGSYSLAGAASGSDTAQCSQQISVQPNTAYTLSAWVQGGYVFLGTSGGADSSTWTSAASGWQQLTTSFTTGASTNSVTVFLHGWYGQGTYYADDVSLIGPGGGGGPGAPTNLAVTGSTSSSISLSWTAPTGTVTGYNVYENGSQVGTTTSTSYTATGLTPSTSYTFAVTATNSGGEGPQSNQVTATTQNGNNPPPPGGFSVAPYVDMTNLQEPMLDKAATQAGLKTFTAAFVISSGCTPVWGDTLPVTNDPTVTGEITKAEGEGATPIVSFGGEGGTELAETCTDLTQLTAAYQSVINTLHVNHIDFDIEGAEIANTADTDLRFKAINNLESANPGLVVSVTIPSLPTGPDYNGESFIQHAQADGTRIDLMNLMTMDFGGSWDGSGKDMGAYSTEAATDGLATLKKYFPNATYANVGITPMIGQNDDSNEVFSQANAQTLVSFASANHLGRLAFWSVDRDQPCGGSANGLPSCSETSQQPLDFTKIFLTYTG